MANYLRRYVPQVNVNSQNERMARTEIFIKDLINEICPYVTKWVLVSKFHPENIKYLDNNRLNVGADPEANIWSNSRIICQNESNLREQFIKSVINHMMIEPLESDVSKMPNTDSNAISQFLFPVDGDVSTSTSLVGAGDIIELFEKLVKIPGENQQEIMQLLKLRNITWDLDACSLKNLGDLEKLNMKYKNNQVIGLYVRSMIALQYNICYQKTRWQGANLANTLTPLQLTRLNEFRNILKQFQEHLNRPELRESPFINAMFGYGRCARIFINRYKFLDSEYSRAKCGLVCINLSLHTKRTRDFRKDMLRIDMKDAARDRYNSVMSELCGSTLDNLPSEQLYLMQKLLNLMTDEKLGSLTIQLFDYTNICRYHNSGAGFEDLYEALRQKMR